MILQKNKSKVKKKTENNATGREERERETKRKECKSYLLKIWQIPVKNMFAWNDESRPNIMHFWDISPKLYLQLWATAAI